MEISNEEFNTITKEKRKYEKMKENMRNLNRKLDEINKIVRLGGVKSKIFFFFLVLYI